jgi:hypothetical protein
MNINRRFPPIEMNDYTASPPPRTQLYYNKKKYLNPTKNDLNIFLIIPNLEKFFIWFNNKNVELYSEKNGFPHQKIKMFSRGNSTKNDGTVLYGSIIFNKLNNINCFIIEDIFYFKGISLKKLLFSYKLGCIYEFLKNNISEAVGSIDPSVIIQFKIHGSHGHEKETYKFFLCKIELPKKNIVSKIQSNYASDIREKTEKTDKLIEKTENIFEKEKEVKNIPPLIQFPPQKNVYLKTKSSIEFRANYYKPQYNYPAVFKIKADSQYDIYHLFVCGKKRELIYYGVAGIPSYKISVFMNTLFRKIKENQNLDYIEESDDEEEFENTDVNKYVITDKFINMKCIFSHKFKKWIPDSVVQENINIVHFSKL